MDDEPENNPEDRPVDKDLYFVPILARALREPDRAEALRRAFAEIEELGREDAHRLGHEQFRQFMAEAAIPQLPDILLEKDGEVIGRIQPSAAAREVLIPRVTPGEYALRLSNGRLLWTGTIDAAELLWARAFPGTPLPMAADSDAARCRCSREERLLGGEVVLRVYPGVERGSIGIQIPPREA